MNMDSQIKRNMGMEDINTYLKDGLKLQKK